MSDTQQAIIRTGGKQYRVETGQVLRVSRLHHQAGSRFTIDDVLLVGRGAEVEVGTPRVAGVRVEAEVVEHGRGRKLVVYKFKPRRNYRRKQGHRQHYTEIRITDIQRA